MSKMKVMKPNDDGWCDWVIPRNTYRLGCCDCGLVHDMEFEVIKKLKDLPSGEFEYAVGGNLNRAYRVRFRARRNNRSTAALRRGKKRS